MQNTVPLDLSPQLPVQEDSVPNAELKQKNQLKIFGIFIFEITGLLVIFALFLLILNYFNILSISTLYPKQLGFLPHINSTKPASRTVMVIGSKPQPTIIPVALCPLPEGCKDYTKLGKSKYTASSDPMGITLTAKSTDSAVLAAMEGTLAMEGKTIVKITNTVDKYTIVYDFLETTYSPLIQTGNIKQGDIIGQIKSTISNSKPYSFVLYIQPIDTANSYLNITISNDGETIIIDK